jgi:IS1 family transposase
MFDIKLWRHRYLLQKRYNELFQARARYTRMLLKAIEHGADIRTTDTWPKYQSIIDKLWHVSQQIKAVQACLTT